MKGIVMPSIRVPPCRRRIPPMGEWVHVRCRREAGSSFPRGSARTQRAASSRCLGWRVPGSRFRRSRVRGGTRQTRENKEPTRAISCLRQACDHTSPVAAFVMTRHARSKSHSSPSLVRSLCRSCANGSHGRRTGQTKHEKGLMIVLGIILLIIGFIASVAILWTVGIILVVIGLFLELLGMAGHAVGGRRHYY